MIAYKRTLPEALVRNLTEKETIHYRYLPEVASSLIVDLLPSIELFTLEELEAAVSEARKESYSSGTKFGTKTTLQKCKNYIEAHLKEFT